MACRPDLRLIAVSMLTLGAVTTPGDAAEPEGCDAFRWPAEPIRAVLQSEHVELASGATTAFSPGKPLRVKLQPQGEVALAAAPQKPPRNAAPFAGILTVAAPPAPGSYAVAMSAGGWIETIQDGKNLRATAFSGATGCPGLRKVVVFALDAKPLTLQLSDVAADLITIAILQAP